MHLLQLVTRAKLTDLKVYSFIYISFSDYKFVITTAELSMYSIT